MAERLQKVLARHGLGSRREIERWIIEGRVTVNRQIARTGQPYRPGDRVAIDGKEVTARLQIEVPPRVLLFHKAQGQPIAHDARTARPPMDGAPEAEIGDEVDEGAEYRSADESTAVMDSLPAVRGAKWIPINPMHGGDSGLLLLTTDGTLGYAMTRRKRWIPTAYMVRVLAPRQDTPPQIPLQVSYDDEQIEFTKVEPSGGEGSNLWFRVELARADRRAAVRALFESRDLKVSRMTQVSFGSIELPRNLPRNRYRELTVEEVETLYSLASLPAPASLRQPVVRPAVRAQRRPAPDRRKAAKPKSPRAASKPERANKLSARRPPRKAK